MPGTPAFSSRCTEIWAGTPAFPWARRGRKAGTPALGRAVRLEMGGYPGLFNGLERFESRVPRPSRRAFADLARVTWPNCAAAGRDGRVPALSTTAGLERPNSR